jgi:hypothetical protein
MHYRGIEPRSAAWKAAIITTRPIMPISLAIVYLDFKKFIILNFSKRTLIFPNNFVSK